MKIPRLFAVGLVLVLVVVTVWYFGPLVRAAICWEIVRCKLSAAQ